MQSFVDTWPQQVWPIIQKKYEELLEKRPAKQSDATGGHYGQRVYEFLQTKGGEVRNITCNLAYLDPVRNTFLQQDISVEAVERFALDLYVDTSPGTDSVPGDEATEGGTQNEDGASDAGPTLAETLLAAPKKAWKIPSKVPRGLEIPVAITSTATEPEKGKWRRLGLDVAVNATWLAMKWAIEEKNDEAVSALENLVLDWPFDFHLFAQDDEEDRNEQIFKFVVNLPARVERLRDFCGLDASNLMRITAQVRDLLQKKTLGGVLPTPRRVHEWMTEGENIHWGLYHAPSLRTVTSLLVNWDAVKNNKMAMLIMDRARQLFGRDNLFDWPTKISVLVAKTEKQQLAYVFEALFTHMQRKGVKDPVSVEELKCKGGTVQRLLWQRRYISTMLTEFPDMLKTTDGASVSKLLAVSQLLQSPSELFEKTEGQNRDPTWMNTLPNEALRMFAKHVVEVMQGFYMAELRGALSTTNAQKWNWERFLESERVKKRFTLDFKIAYDSIASKKSNQNDKADDKQAADEENKTDAKFLHNAEGNDGAVSVPLAVDACAKTPQNLLLFRKECEQFVSKELQARTVVLTQDGEHSELRAMVSSTRLYQNLAEVGARFVGFYDVKNAKLVDLWVGEALTQREPVLDEEKFKAPRGAVSVTDPVLRFRKKFPTSRGVHESL